MMAARQMKKTEILSNVHQAMRLLTTALEALSVGVDEDHLVAMQRLRAAVAATKSVPVEAHPAKYVVFDFETNGIGKTANIRVCQIGATALSADFGVVDHFAHFVNPTVKMDKGATKIHGFDTDFVSKFDSWETVGANFMAWLDLVRNANKDNPLTLMAHNGKRFDARILVSENARHGIEMPRNLYHCDSIDVMKTLFPGKNSYALGRIYEDVIGEPLADAHDATADVNGVIQILKRGHPRELETAIATHQESFNHIIKRALKVT
tara:strand:- start:3573 stop:4367 length:795 start_codon:yes stop_codon:yes gene_type:complete